MKQKRLEFHCKFDLLMLMESVVNGFHPIAQSTVLSEQQQHDPDSMTDEDQNTT